MDFSKLIEEFFEREFPGKYISVKTKNTVFEISTPTDNEIRVAFSKKWRLEPSWFRKTRVFFDDQEFTDKELSAILSHEVAHLILNHSEIRTDFIIASFIAFGGIACFPFKTPKMALVGLFTGWSLMRTYNFLSRFQEFEADLSVGDQENLISGLRKIQKVAPDPAVGFFEKVLGYGHIRYDERIKIIQSGRVSFSIFNLTFYELFRKD